MKSKILWLVIGLVVLALGAGVFIAYKASFIKPSADVGDVTLALSPSSGTHNLGEPFDVAIKLDTAGVAVTGAKAYLNYNPDQLEVQDADAAKDGVQISPGSIFNTVTDNDVSSGKIKFSAIALASADYTGSAGVLATIKFKAKTAGTSKVTFDFIAGSLGQTSGVTKDAANILKSVTDGSYTISAATPATVTSVTLTANDKDALTINDGDKFTLKWNIVVDPVGGTFTCEASPTTTPSWYTGQATGTATLSPGLTTTYKLTCGTATPQVSDQVIVTVSGVLTCATVSVYDDANYGAAGAAGCYPVGSYTNLGPLNDLENNISSVKVASGYKITLWDSNDYTGTSIVLTADTPDLSKATPNLNNLASSFKVETVATACVAPLTETRTQTCPTGQTGSITQTRTKGAAPTCAWGDWKETTNTCKVATAAVTPSTTTPTATATPAGTGPETPLVAGGLLGLAFGAFYWLRRKI